MQYRFTDIGIIIPTKDRPEKIGILLNSIKDQSVDLGRILVIDGGESIKTIIDGFKNDLPVEYYECKPPGQIRQKIMGISLIDERTPLVGFFDDDIVLTENALNEMLNFWNTNNDENTAGVSFNIINAPGHRHNVIKGLIGLSSPEQGRVLKSGMNVSIVAVAHDIKTQWLSGGATIWKKDILKEYPQEDMRGRWAVCEDLMYSYPIGEKHSLYVCSKAKVRHEHVYDHLTKVNHIYYGRTEALRRYYFVSTNKELSQLWFFWHVVSFGITRILYGLMCLDERNLKLGIGSLSALIIITVAKILGKNIVRVIEKNN